MWKKTYALSADFFTQDLFTNVVNNDGDQGDYMDTWTTELDADVIFDVGQAVMVPANGSADVQVTVRLTDSQKEALKQYPAGAYLQGFVYAKSEATEEGVEGTEHSIPVLGFYGNWSDASMFEVGSRAEYETGSEVRLPYLGNTKVNTAAITYANDPEATYYFGGNPLVADARYMPERNAINSENGDQISQISFCGHSECGAQPHPGSEPDNPWRTPAGDLPRGSKLRILSHQRWCMAEHGLSLQHQVCTQGCKEGDRLELSLTLAPEYYVDAQGNVGWDDLGEGATMTIPMVVDNTARSFLDVSLSLMGSTMTVKAKDNQYVAGVVLYNAAGSKVLAKTGAKQDIQPGEAAEYALDLAGMSGKSFLVQVSDYAMNTTTYQLNLQTGGDETLPDMMAYQSDHHIWIGFGAGESGSPSELASTQQVYTAATSADGLVFAATSHGDLYVLSEEDLALETHVANMGVVLRIWLMTSPPPPSTA